MSQEDAKLKKRIMQKYIFDDQGKHLRSKMFNLTVEWNIMPKVGKHFLVGFIRLFVLNCVIEDCMQVVND